MRIDFLRFFACLLLALFWHTAFSQKKSQARDSSVIIVFSENKAIPKSKRSGEDNIIKIAPLGFINGTFPILYERRITDFLGIEAGGGLTNRNFIRSLLVGEAGMDESRFTYPWPESSGHIDVSEPVYQFKYRKPAMGYMFRIMPRIYWESEAPDGGYVGLQYQFVKYRFNIPAMETHSNEFLHTGPMVSESENVNDFMVFFGRQYVNDKITVDFTSGVGMRKVKGSKYVASASTGSLLEGMASYEQNRFNFAFAFTLGYHF